MPHYCWGALDQWYAPRQLVWPGGTLNAFQVLSAIARRVGVRVVGAGGSAELGAIQPAFTVRAGERGGAALRRLPITLPDLVRMVGTVAELTEPAPDDAPGYAYGTEHPLLEARLEAGRGAAGWARVFGAGVFAEAVDEARLAESGGTALAVDDNLQTQARVNARAATLLRAGSAGRDACGGARAGARRQEPGDVVSLTDAALGLEAAAYRVRALRPRYERAGARPRYELALTLTAV